MKILSEFIYEDKKILTIELGKNEEIEVKRKKAIIIYYNQTELYNFVKKK